MKASMLRHAILFGTLLSAAPAAGAHRNPADGCPAQGVVAPVGESECAVVTCMLAWPSGPSVLQGKTPGCAYQLTYCYELLGCAEDTLYLLSSSVTDPMVGPGSPPDSLMGVGTRGFFWPDDGDPEKLLEHSVATFQLGDVPLLEWRVTSE